MSIWKTLAKVGNYILEEGGKEMNRQMRNGKRNPETGRVEIPTYAGRTIRQWESSWQYVGYLDSLNLSAYSSYVGLYKAQLGGTVMYVGRATEYSNGGLRKRLSDYTRQSDSARKHTSGRLMHANASDLSIYLLVVGQDREAVEATKTLERYFIRKYSPEWNKMLR